MKIKPCKRCQNVDVFGRYQYCPECKEVVEAELKAMKSQFKGVIQNDKR